MICLVAVVKGLEELVNRMNKFVPFILLLFLSGCMSSAQQVENNTEIETERFVHSYQFWNEYPVGTGNITVINQTGILSIEMRSGFIEDAGYVSLSIFNQNESVFSVESRNEWVFYEVPVKAGMTIETLAEGNHSVVKSPIGDYYAIYFLLHYEVNL